MSNYEKIQGTGRTGDFVHNNQKMGGDKGFSNVSAAWLPKCLTYEQGREQMAIDRRHTEDIKCGVDEMIPAVDEKGRFVLEHQESGRQFRPTDHALRQLCNRLSLPVSTIEYLYGRDDALAHDSLNYLFTNEFMRYRKELGQRRGKWADRTSLIWRTRDDNTLRAVLTEMYATINNEWMMDVIQETIPSGLLSHWRGDSDSIWGNVLVPDSLRHEEDSDYGGMVSISNCEIGTRRIGCVPSVFRAICMNGCIWDQKQGKGIKQVHRGKIDLHALKREIQYCIRQQLDLLPTWMDTMLQTRELTTATSITPVFAQVAIDHKLTRPQARGMLEAAAVEAGLYNSQKQSLFGVINAVTRAAQARTNNTEWANMEMVAGKLVTMGRDGWERLTKRAASLTSEQVEAPFAMTA